MIDSTTTPHSLFQMLEQIPEISIALDRDGAIRWWNAEAARTLEVADDESVFTFVDQGSQQKLRRFIEQVSEHHDVVTEIVLIVSERPILYSMHLFHHEEHLVLMARKSSEDTDRFLEMSSMLSQFAALYRESSQQRTDLEEQSEKLAGLSRELDRERRRLLSLIDQLPEGVILINDRSGEISLTNLRIRELWNLDDSPHHIQEIPFFRPDGTSTTPDALPVFRTIASRVDEGPDELLIRPETDEQLPVYVQVIASPVIDEDDEVIGAVMSIVDITEQKRLRDELAVQASQDPLTGLGNRRMFFQQVEQALERDLTQGGIAVLYVDLDGFKAINDTLGHDAGDEALMEVGARLRQSVRENDVVSRIGGDEFAVLLPSVRDHEQVETIVRRILEAMSSPMEIQGQRLRLPGSIGIDIISDRASVTAGEMVRRADMAMYQAKSTGASRWAYYDELSGDAGRESLSVSEDIHRALDTEQFEMLYHPVVDFATGRVREVEIALFWRHSIDGLLDDVEIRARASRAGLLHAIAERAADLGERDRPLILEAIAGRGQIVMSRHYWIDFLREDRVVDQLLEIADAVAGAPIRVRLELSGRLVPGDDSMLERLESLNRAGIDFAIAHAGDYDGDLALLRHLNVQSIVLAPGLIRDAQDDVRAAAFARSLVATAVEFGIPTKVPAIDTHAKLQVALNLGCNAGSGSLFSEPLGADELLEFSIDRVFPVARS